MKRDVVNIIFGDSISYGLFDTELYGWLNRIKNKSKFMKNSFYFNLSIPGQNSNKIVERFNIETKNRCSDGERINIIFSFGINDTVLLNDNSNHKIQFEKNLIVLFEQAKKYTSNIYFIGLPCVDLEVKKNYNENSIKIIEKKIIEKCKQNDVIYIAINDVLSKEDLVDGVHPTMEGHQKLADYLYENLFKKIENDEKIV